MEDFQDHGGTPQAETGTNENSNEAQASNYVTVDQLNKVLTNYRKRGEADMTKLLQDQSTSFSKMFDELKESFRPEVQKDDSPHKDENKPNPELLKLQKQLADMESKYKRMEEEKNIANSKAKDEKIKAEVLSHLTNLKVERGDQVYRLIRDNILYDEDTGKIKFRLFDPEIGIEDEKDIKSGLSTWLNSEGSHFLPPRNLSGSGATGKQGISGNKVRDFAALKKMTPQELAKVNLKDYLSEDDLKIFFNTP